MYSMCTCHFVEETIWYWDDLELIIWYWDVCCVIYHRYAKYKQDKPNGYWNITGKDRFQGFGCLINYKHVQYLVKILIVVLIPLPVSVSSVSKVVALVVSRFCHNTFSHY